MAAFPYRLYGGATRPDAISGLDPRFSQALHALYAAAPPAVQRELGLNSAYRSAAVQQGLWDRSDKTGHSVARPGHSKHQAGTAADLYGFGLGGAAKVSQATRDWVNANAASQGLYFPMGHEPWHIQLRGGGGAAPVAGAAQESPLATTLADAAQPPDSPLSDLATGYAGNVAKTHSAQASPRLMAGGTSEPPPTFDVASAMPNALPSIGQSQATPSLAELFQVKDIGTPPLRPGRRF